MLRRLSSMSASLSDALKDCGSRRLVVMASVSHTLSVGTNTSSCTHFQPQHPRLLTLIEFLVMVVLQLLMPNQGLQF